MKKLKEIAYLVQKHHVDDRLDYSLFKSINYIIIEYTYKDNEYITKILEMAKYLKINIGIYVPYIPNINEDDIVNDLVDKIKNADIVLGVWINNKNTEQLFRKIMSINYNNFIIGSMEETIGSNIFKYSKIFNMPAWKDSGYIQYNNIINLGYCIHGFRTYALNKNFKSIYTKNKFKCLAKNTK